MIEAIINLLAIVKKEKATGRYIDIALGKNKYPESFKEAYIQFKREIQK